MKNTIFKCLILGFVTLTPLTHAGYSEINTVGDGRSTYNAPINNSESIREKLSYKAKYTTPVQPPKKAK